MRQETIAPPAAPQPDLEAFAREVAALRKEIDAALGPEDLAHLRKMIRWGRIASAIGMATAWAGPNPVSIAGLALGRGTRWMIMHHVGHRGYDKVEGTPPELTSSAFARGVRRVVDWMDWIEPEAWKHEHNVLHHGNTGEEADPDLFERNVTWVHPLPAPVRWALLGGLTATWRATYYAPATMAALLTKQSGEEPTARVLYMTVLRRCWLPYAGYAFVALPLVFAPLGPLAVASAFVNSVAADVVANMHTFLVVGPNHAGSDLFRFADRPKTKGERLARQVVGSTNYATGGDLVDFAHLWLNYQIEHHLFPDLPMLRYREVQPKVEALCAKYGIPYTQESVFRRFAKMAKIFIGTESMRRDADSVLSPQRAVSKPTAAHAP